MVQQVRKESLKEKQPIFTCQNMRKGIRDREKKRTHLNLMGKRSPDQ
jgi:hypothetical protein